MKLYQMIFLSYMYPPPPLHTSSGIFNDIFDAMDQILVAYQSTMKATDWSDMLSLTRDGHYGGKAVFKGRQSRKLLENLDKLETLLHENNSRSYCEPILDCFKSLYAVLRSCIGMVLYPRYPDDILAFAHSFFKLKEHAEQINELKKLTGKNKIHVSVTLKVHSFFIHVKQYLEHLKETKNSDFGLGFSNEQR